MLSFIARRNGHRDRRTASRLRSRGGLRMELLEDRRVLAGTGDPMDFGVIWTEDAENGLRHIIDGSDAQYPLIQSAHVFEGANAFHLAHPSPASNWLEIDRTLTIGDDTQLFFMSRLSWATSTQIARVQLSTDGGQSWPEEVYSQTGEGSGDQGFMFRQVDLSAFAGQEVRIRFFYEYAGGVRYPHTDPGIGWMIDDIRVASRYETAEYSIGDPTDWEQWMLEFANRGRADAVAESHRLAAESSQQLIVEAYAASMEDGHINRHAQPLAFNAVLLEAARLHSQDMLNNDFQGHTSSANPPEPFVPGFGPTQRAESLGYRGGVGENAFAYARSVPHSHSAFANSTGHRHNLHRAGYNEVGFAALPGTNGRVGPIVVTQKLSRSDGPLITGVVYQDLDGDAFYTPGEGRGGVRVEVEGAAFHAVSSASGGYAVPVPGDGVYLVTFSGAGFETWSTQVVVTAGENVKVDPELRVSSENDPPVFTMPTPSVFVRDENDGSPWVHANFATGIAPGPPNAREELEQQGITFSFSEVDVPEGMMTAPPTMTVNGNPGNWPGTGTLSIVPAAGAFGFAVYDVSATDTNTPNPLTTTKRLTVTIDPINDPPVAFERTLTVREAVEADGETAVLEFTAADLIVGGPGESANRAADLPASVPAPFDESEQSLSVVAFGIPDQPPVDAADMPDGSGTVTRTLPSGGEIEFRFADGVFVNGTYTPPIDFNDDPVFGGSDTFTYIIEDDGKTTIPGGDGVPLFLPPERSRPATVTLRVLPANDPPELQAHAAIHLAEREEDGIEVVSGWATRIAPGPSTAADEWLRQSVTLDFVAELSTLPDGLFHAEPLVSPEGTLTLFPAAHAVGSAEIVIRATDHEETPGFVPRSTLASVTVHVQPVNDPPRLVVERLGTGDSLEGGRAWQVTFQGAIRYTLPEDNTGPGGDTSEDFFIPLESQGGSSQEPIGLLDLFDVGPANEQDATPGGNQTLSLVDDFPRATLLGGQLTLGSLDGRSGVFYRPPRDANLLTAGIDYFDYTVTDDGQTYLLGDSAFTSGTLVSDPKTARGHVQLRLNPINDPPVFAGAPDVDSDEGDGLVTIPNWATEIRPGPETAVDEVIGRPDAQPPIPPQSVEFLISPVPDQWQTRFDPLFTIPPTVTIQGETATLSYQAAPHANGIAVFDIVLMDDGPHDPQRGDINRGEPVRFTISVAAVNDPPQFEPGGEVLIGPDRGPYAAPWATEVLPGPPTAIDELAEQTVRFELFVPGHGHELFTADGLPTLGGDGILRFTPAPEAQGQILIDVVAVDSLGARSEPAELTITMAHLPGPPLTNDDRVGTYRGDALDIDLSAGVIATTAEVDPGSIEIVTPPSAGDLTILGDGRVRYVAAADASGEDRFAYRIRDIDGRVSDPATVTVLIATSPLQNPFRHADVNADGNVTALDALLVINYISRHGSGGVPTISIDDGAWYYDVNGDGVVTALDALLVINHIARGDSPGEGEGAGDQPVRDEAPSPLAPPTSAKANQDRLDAIFRLDDNEDWLSGSPGEPLATPWGSADRRKVKQDSKPHARLDESQYGIDRSEFDQRAGDFEELRLQEYDHGLIREP